MKMANDNLGHGLRRLPAGGLPGHAAVAEARALYMCMSSSELHRLHAAFNEAGGHWSTYVIWAKNTFTLGRSDYQRQYEPILYGWRKGGRHFWCGDRNQGDVWFDRQASWNALHPTMKPVELIERALDNSSQPGKLFWTRSRVRDRLRSLARTRSGEPV